MSIRGLIITDSLGCPRDEINVEDTWTDLLIQQENKMNICFYTYCVRGLHSKTVPYQYIISIKPDIIIFQVGIVDASRRAMSETINKIVKRIPLVSRVVNHVCSKYHYQITKHINIHYASENDIKSLYTNILNNTSAKLFIILIAPSSLVIKKKTFNIENDINRYNNVFKSLKEKYDNRIILINPYEGLDPDELFINDGHHLNKETNYLVYKMVNEQLLNCMVHKLRGKE